MGDRATWQLRLPLLILLLMVLIYACLFGYLTVMEHRVFWTGCYDLGNMDQAVWNSIHGAPLKLTTVSGVDSRLEIHVEPILLLIAPLYLVYDRVEVLLILQSVVIAVGALFVFLLAETRLGNSWAAVAIAFAYLAYPPLQAANVFHFHAVTLSPAFVLAALYFVEKERFGAHYVFSALAMSCKEDVPLIVIMLGAYLLVVKRQWKHGASTVAFGALWFGVDVFLILPAFSKGDLLHIGRYGEFGDSLSDVITNLLTHPRAVISYLATEERCRYVLSLLTPLALLPLLGPEGLLLALPTLAVNLLSNFSAQYAVDDFHYSAPAVAGFVAGAVWGIRHLSQMLTRILKVSQQVWISTLAAVLFLVSGSALYHRGALPLFGFSDWPEPGTHVAIGHNLLAQIPSDAAVSAQTSLAPHLTHRTNIYQYPVIADAEYVVFDTTSGSVWPMAGYDQYYESVTDLVQRPDYGVWAAEDGYLILKRSEGLDDIPESFYSFVRRDTVDPEYKVDVQFGDTDPVHLVGYDLEARRGDRLRLTVYLRPENGDFGGLETLVSILDAEGDLLESRPFLTSTWLRRSDWSSGDFVVLDTGYMSGLPRSDFDLGIWLIGYSPTAVNHDGLGESVSPAFVRLSSSGHQLSLRSFEYDGRQLRDVTSLRRVSVPRSATTLDASIGDAVSLLGYQLSRSHYGPGDTVVLDLYWGAGEGFGGNYTVFVHLMGADGQLIAQHDKQPLDGRYPTSWWSPGEVVRDSYSFVIPESAVSGQELAIYVGMYELDTGLRFPVEGANAASGNRIQLGFIDLR